MIYVTKNDCQQQHQKVVFAEWTILYEKLETIYSSGAKIVLSKQPIGNDAIQYFGDHDMICVGNIPEEDIKRIMIACGGSISMKVLLISINKVYLLNF